jgi:hypothetical protein
MQKTSVMLFAQKKDDDSFSFLKKYIKYIIYFYYV